MTLDTLTFIVGGGIVLGGLYALMALGLALVWTSLGIFNFAHGAFIVLGAYLGWQFSHVDAAGLGLIPATLLMAVLMFGFGYVFYWLLIKPFERLPQAVLLTVISTLAGATIIENAVVLIWGPRARQVERLIVGQIDAIAVSRHELLLLFIVLIVLAATGWFLRRTRTGRSMRAAALNRDAAQLMGLNVSRLYGLAFALSAMVAGLAGLFLGSLRFMSPAMGSAPLMKAMVIVILGGIARFTGPIYAAFIVGIIESFSVFYIGLYWTPAVLFGLMILALIIKPEGLFGRQQRTV